MMKLLTKNSSHNMYVGKCIKLQTGKNRVGNYK